MAAQAGALSIGAAGGLLASRVGMPLPWMLGAMIFVMIAAITRVPVAPPILLRTITIPILGVFLGAGFHPGMFSGGGAWMVSLLILPVYVAAAFAIGHVVYRRIGGYDPVTAYFSSAPGGLTDMMLIGSEAGGIERRIALAHASRIFIVVCLVALAYAIFFDASATGASRPYTAFDDIRVVDLVILVACAVGGALLGPKIGLPAPMVLGPMILSAIVHMTGATSAQPPTLAVNTAQLVLGTVIGCRFAGVAPAEVFRDMRLATLSAGLMLACATVFALIVATMTSTSASQVFLGFSPGGLAEMSLLAVALDADVAYVATMHIARITLVIAFAPVVFHRYLRR